MVDILNIYKPIAVTPYQLIVRLREELSEYKDVKMGYAGRLDPLAHGVLLLMLDEANKKRDQYNNLEKTYEFRVLFGVETDSFDYLGLLRNKFEIQNSKSETNTKDQNKNDQNVLNLKNSDFDIVSSFDIRASDLTQFARSKLGRQVQAYPPFSSKTIGGISLFKLAKRGKLEGKTIPTREVMINEFQFLGMEHLTSKDLEAIIIPNLKKIRGYFRQEKIIKQWKEFFREHPDEVFSVAKFSVSCTSGTYVRSMAHEMGQVFGTGAIALEILRTKVGEYTLEEALRLDVRSKI